MNNPKTRTIEPNPVKVKVIKKAFEECAQGCHTLESLGQRLSFWGVASRTGKPICKATLQRMLTNKVCLGLIVHNGETYEGGFPSIVSRATFEKVQEMLKNRAKSRHSKKRHYFPFTGFLTCGECGRGNRGSMGARRRRDISLYKTTWSLFAKIFKRRFIS